MLLSKFLGLKKPEQDDFYNIEDFNSNTDLIDETFEELSKNKVDLGQAKIFDESYSVGETFFKAVMDDFFERYVDIIQPCHIYMVEYATLNDSWFVFLVSVNETGENHSADVLIYNRYNFFKYYYKPSSDEFVTQRIDNKDIVADLTASDNTKFRFATDGEGNYGFLKADDSFVPFKKGGNVTIDGVPFEGDVLNLVSEIIVASNSISTLPYNFYNGSAVVLNNEIHILGGNGKRTAHYKWNGKSWVQVSTLPYNFEHGGCVVYNNEIHILGTTFDSSYYKAHYKWNGTSWEEVSTLPFDLYYGSAVVLNNEIHILGGNGGYTKHYKYNGSTWTEVSTLPYEFYQGCAVVYNNEIHILGGRAYKEHYKYDGTSWIKVSTLPYEFYQGCAVVYNNEIHILGGNGGYTKHYKYDGTSWIKVSTLPYEFYYGSAVVYNDEIQILGSYSSNYSDKYHYSIIKKRYKIA